jgi:phosphoribosyl-AMP cyclohydrolase
MPTPQPDAMTLHRVATFPRLRALAWDGDLLYASRGYSLLRARMNAASIEWHHVAQYSPAWWRNLSVSSRLAFRLFRDGFHALVVLASGHIVAAMPGSILTLAPGEGEFRVSHRVLRGTRPLHLAVTPDDHIFWGEYFDNPGRDEVHIYASTDRGDSWHVAHTFPRGAIRHVHNIVYDECADCLWVLTGDNGDECRILRVSCDFKSVDVVLAGNQQARAVALVPTAEGLYFSSDTPLESNHIYCLERGGKLAGVASLSSSSIFGCRVGEALFFSTMVEPSRVNPDPTVRLYGSRDGRDWQPLLQWRKDLWPMSLFQYGNALLPDGRNTSGLLALTTVAVEGADCETSLWRF